MSCNDGQKGHKIEINKLTVLLDPDTGLYMAFFDITKIIEYTRTEILVSIEYHPQIDFAIVHLIWTISQDFYCP